MKKTLLLLVITMVLSVGLAFSQGTPVAGEWECQGDESNGGDSTVAMTTGTKDGMTTYTFKGNTTTKYEYGYSQWEIKPDAASLANLKKAKTITFKVLGDGKRYTIKYRISSVFDYGYHEYSFNTRAGQEQTIRVTMAMFMQPAWADKKGLRVADFTGISWQTHENWRPNSFEITIWDLRVEM